MSPEVAINLLFFDLTSSIIWFPEEVSIYVYTITIIKFKAIII